MLGLSTIQLAIGGAILALFLSMAGVIAYQHHENGALHEANATLKDNLDQAVKVNQGNVAQIAAIKADAARTVAALTKDHAAELQRATRTAQLKETIARAPKTDDAVAAPVLAGVLDGLRARGAAGDKDRAGAPVDPGAASVVPR